jgi:hypothetical protein
MDDTTFCIDALAELFYKNLLETEDLGRHLGYCEITGRLILMAAFIKNLARFDDELMSCISKDWTLVGRHKRTIITMLGEITYMRRVYKDNYGNRRRLLDEVLGIVAYQHIDKDAFLWIVNCAADISFEKTARAFNGRTYPSSLRLRMTSRVTVAGDTPTSLAISAMQVPALSLSSIISRCSFRMCLYAFSDMVSSFLARLSGNEERY